MTCVFLSSSAIYLQAHASSVFKRTFQTVPVCHVTDHTQASATLGYKYGNIQSDLFAKSALKVNLCEDEDDSQIQLSSVITGYKTFDNTSEENSDITTSLIHASCAMCPEKDDNNMIQCSICHYWLLFSCTKLPVYQVKILSTHNENLHVKIV